MKPAPFAYVAPRSLDEALGSLAGADTDTKLLAGGQSLIPLLNMRLAAPARLVDLGRVQELAYVWERDGGYAIGAMTRQRALERDDRITRDLPLLAEAVRWVGHPQIRSRGTIGGSIAHADPAAELPAVAVCLDAQATLQSARGSRTVAASDLYLGYLATTLAPDEILSEVWFPSAPARTGYAWLEFARRHGDYAIAGVGIAVTLDDRGADTGGDGGEDRHGHGGRHGNNHERASTERTVVEARIVATGVGGTPIRASAAEAVLAGARLDANGQIEATRVSEAVAALRSAVEPESDVQATAAYRRHLVGVLLERALPVACRRVRL